MRLIDANSIPWEEYYVPDPDSNAQWDYKKERSVLKPVVDQMPTVDAVVIPCKIGDEVWAIRNYHGIKHPQKGFVSDMLFTRDMKLHIVVKHIARGEWGKNVFATYEDAAEAIGERKDNGQ